MTDYEIIRLFFARSEEAIDALREKYGRLIRRVVKNILPSEEDAEECIADTYLTVWDSIPPQKPDPLLAYTAKIARNHALDRYRYNHAARRYSGDDVLLDELTDILHGEDSPETAIDAAALSYAISEFLRKQKENDRKLFIRRYWYGDDLPVLAKEWGITVNTATVRLFRIREKLRTYLSEKGFVL